jgi:hypothetical protein
MKRLSQILAWVLVFGIVSLSIVPPDYRVVTDLPRLFEHLSKFLIAGVAFGFGYPDRYPMQSIALVLFAADVELMQGWGSWATRAPQPFLQRQSLPWFGNRSRLCLN